LEPEQALSLLRAAGLPALDPQLLAGFALPMLRQLAAQHRDGVRLPLLALNGPVGVGKSSLGRVLEALAPAFELRLRVASIDDLYLPWPERQRRLAGNPFGVSRVPPGSHDLDLLLAGLASWRQSGVLRLPRFDKTLVQGQGDRCGWRQGPCDALVLEGWLLGCQALGAEALAMALGTWDLSRPGPGDAPALEPLELDWLETWDRQLAAYGPLWQACDGLWVLRPLSWTLPRRWRFQAEARQRRRGGGWLPADDLAQLVRSSLCSLPPLLYQDPLVASWMGSLNAARTGAAQLDWNDLSRDAGVMEGPVADASGAQARQASALQGVVEPDRPQPAWPIGAEPQNHGPLGEVPTTATKRGLVLQGLAVLDGRRRCVAIQHRHCRPQDSLSDSSSLIG
jgi:D-glycerate 3-kinase